MDGQQCQEQLMKQLPDPQQDTSQNEIEETFEHVQEVFQVEPPQPVIDSSTPEKMLDLSFGGGGIRSSYTVEFKIYVLKWYHENGENKSRTSKQFGVDRKRVREWLRAEDILHAMPLANRMRKKKLQEGKPYGRRFPPGYEQLDQAVLNWYKEQRAIGKAVYSVHLRAKALEVGPQCGLPETFRASAMWLERWKKRHAVDIKEVEGEIESHTDRGKSYGRRTPGSEQLDQAVLNWYKEQRTIGKAVYAVHLRAKALELGPQCGVPENFRASAMWLKGWKRRHAVDIKEVEGREGTHTDSLQNVTIQTDLEEEVCTHLTDGQDDGSNSLSESGTSGSMNGILSPQMTGHSSKYQLEITDPLNEKMREQEQCIGVVEQTLDSLEVEFSKKIDQMKLVIQQLKSVQEQMKQQLTSSSAATETSLSTPGANKRPSTVPVTSTRQVKRPRTT